AIGSALWAAVLIGAGYLLGEHYDRVEQYISPISKVVLVLLVLGAAAWFVRRKREQQADAQ
ncbi:MAG: alkaline phosphatase, partial [Deinococcus sp.]|nr:alkaline phosphatase [Deinococcus sp.]